MAEVCQPISASCDFRAVYEAYHGFVWYTLRRLGTATEAVEDAVQDVFIVAYRRRATFAGPSAKAWLYGIARRVASNYRRSRRRHHERIRALRTAQPRTTTAETREAIETLDRYLAGLSSTDREIFVLAEIEGMTGPEISAAFGRNLQTTYTRIRKLRLGFRAELSDPAAVKRDHPRASAGSWGALASLISESPAVMAAGWTASLSSAWVAMGLGATVAVGGLVAADRVWLDKAEVHRAGAVAEPEVPRRAAKEPRAPDPARRLPSETAGLPTVSEPPATPAPTVRTPGQAASSAAGKPSGPTSLATENALLRDAAAAVGRGALQEALQLTDQHALQFPRSAFVDLRSAIRIEVLCGLGKSAQARGEAVMFLRRHPDSPAAVRVEKSCAGPS